MVNRMEATNNATKFNGFYAEISSGFVKVINENKNATVRATGETIHALKVQPLTFGWTSSAFRKVYSVGEPYWIRASKVFNHGVKFTQ